MCGFDVYTAVVVLRLLAWFVCCSDLSMNAIVRVPAIAMLPDKTWLKVLRLGRNAITSIAPDAFTHHARIEELDLSENKLTEITEQAFTKCTSLATLLLHQNRIMKIYKNAFRDLAGVPNTEPLKLLSTRHNPLLCTDSPRTTRLDRLMSKTVRHLLHVVRPRLSTQYRALEHAVDKYNLFAHRRSFPTGIQHHVPMQLERPGGVRGQLS